MNSLFGWIFRPREMICMFFSRPRGDVFPLLPTSSQLFPCFSQFSLVFPCFFEPDRVEQYEGDLSWLVMIADIGVRRR